MEIGFHYLIREVLIACSQRFKEQLFINGDFEYWIQFHIEKIGAMIDKWIKEDKEFIFKGLGSNGQEILREENRKYSKKTFLKRKLLNK